MQSMRWLKEPYLLFSMMATSLRILIWAFLLTFFIITLWSILAVTLLNEVVQELSISIPAWQGCDRCARSFHSIWDSNLTFFQTIVAGDSWGLIALPVIQKKWWSIFIFVGALSSVIFGVLNMIAVVVIDTCVERRSKDVSNMATELEYEEICERRRLAALFAKIDEDNSGSLSKDELHWGAEQVPEFRQYLRVLDIDDQDLSKLFDMLDIDASGEIDADEFIDALYRMQSTESRTATRFVKHMVSNLFDKHKCMDDRLDLLQKKVSKGLDHVEKTFLDKLEMHQLEDSPSQHKLQDMLATHTCELGNMVAGAIDKAIAVAFDAVSGMAANHASQAIQQVLLKTNKHAVTLANKALSVCSSHPSSRQISEPRSRQVSYEIGERSRTSNDRHVLHLGESMPSADAKFHCEPVAEEPNPASTALGYTAL